VIGHLTDGENDETDRNHSHQRVKQPGLAEELVEVRKEAEPR
jgi:hypothetical protein